MWGRTLLILGVGGILYAANNLLKLKEVGDKLEVDFAYLEFTKKNEGNMLVILHMAYKNPVDKLAKIEEMKLDVLLEDTLLAKIELTRNQKPLEIQANSSGDLPIPLSTSVKVLVQAAGDILKSFISDDKPPRNAKVIGHLVVNGIRVPYEKIIPFKS